MISEKTAFSGILNKLRKELDSFAAIARGRYLSWENHPEYVRALEESFSRLEKHLANLPIEVPQRILRVILETRIFYQMIRAAYKAGEFQGALLLGIGQEAVGAGAGLALRPYDVTARDHRSVSCAVARGTPISDFWLNHYMKSAGPSGGYESNIHCADPARNDLGFLVSDMGMGAVLINGGTWFVNRKRAHENGKEFSPEERSLGLVIVGDGAASTGYAYSGMNFAKAWNLPIVFIILDNQISLGTSAREQHGGIELSNRGLGFEMPVLSVDGDNALEVYAAVSLLGDFSRNTNHPALISARTFRRCGHNETERTDYVNEIFDQKFLELWQSREKDPLYVARMICEKYGQVSEQEYTNEFLPRAKKVNEEARNIARSSPRPDPENIRTSLIDPESKIVALLAQNNPPSQKLQTMTLKAAIQEALCEEFTHDPMLIMLGEDIGYPRGGVFDVTAPLLKEFRSQIKNSTLDEAAIGGFVAGAGLLGGRVIGEYQFWHFYLNGISPVNTLSATRPFLTGSSIPGVLRGPTGYAPQSNHYHEARIETYLLKAHGVKVVIPSTPEDAKGLLKSAVRDPDLVAFLEEMSEYEFRGEVPEGEYFTPFTAKLCRIGKDITLVTWGPKMVRMSLAAAEKLSQEGIEVDLIDLRVLNPWDKKLVTESLQKTGRLAVVHEDSKFMGFGAEIVAALCEGEPFYRLKARPVRIAAKNTPVPADLALEDSRLPGLQDVIAALKNIMEESHE